MLPCITEVESLKHAPHQKQMIGVVLLFYTFSIIVIIKVNM